MKLKIIFFKSKLNFFFKLNIYYIVIFIKSNILNQNENTLHHYF